MKKLSTFKWPSNEKYENINAFKWPSNEKYENIHNEKLFAIIKKFENHPSIMKIKSKYAIQERFSVKIHH